MGAKEGEAVRALQDSLKDLPADSAANRWWRGIIETAIEALQKNEKLVYYVTEDSIAQTWAEVNCPECREGTCERTSEEHDLARYWALPAGIRAELRDRVREALGNSSVPEAVEDVLAVVLEGEA